MALALHNLKRSAKQSLSSFFSFIYFSFLLISGFLLGFHTFSHPPPTQMFSCLYLIQQQLPQAFFRFLYFRSSPTNIDPFSCLYLIQCYNFSYFALFTYEFSLFLEVSHGAATLTHFSLTHIAATLLTHCTAVVLTHSIAMLIALPHWCSIYSGQSCRFFFG